MRPFSFSILRKSEELVAGQDIPNYRTYITTLGDRGSTVAKVLRYKSEGRWFDPIKSFQSHYGPEVDLDSNRNGYQEYFLGVKAAGV